MVTAPRRVLSSSSLGSAGFLPLPCYLRTRVSTTAEESEHRMQVLPRGRGGVNARKPGALFRVMRRNFVEQVNQGESRGRNFHVTALNDLLGGKFLSVE